MCRCGLPSICCCLYRCAQDCPCHRRHQTELIPNDCSSNIILRFFCYESSSVPVNRFDSFVNRLFSVLNFSLKFQSEWFSSGFHWWHPVIHFTLNFQFSFFYLTMLAAWRNCSFQCIPTFRRLFVWQFAYCQRLTKCLCRNNCSQKDCLHTSLIHPIEKETFPLLNLFSSSIMLWNVLRNQNPSQFNLLLPRLGHIFLDINDG